MNIKQLLIKLGLWEELETTSISYPIPEITVNALWYQQAIKHYCEPCNRWFEKTRGKLMHDRHKHK